MPLAPEDKSPQGCHSRPQITEAVIVVAAVNSEVGRETDLRTLSRPTHTAQAGFACTMLAKDDPEFMIHLPSARVSSMCHYDRFMLCRNPQES